MSGDASAVASEITMQSSALPKCMGSLDCSSADSAQFCQHATL